MTARRVTAATPPVRHGRGLPLAILGGVAAFALVAVAFRSGGDQDAPVELRPKLSRLAAVATAEQLIVEAAAAGAKSSEALGAVQDRYYARGVRRELRPLTGRAATQQRRALLRDLPPGARLLERTVPAGFQLLRFASDQATVAVWSMHVAGPDRGRRLPGAWWLTTRVDLVPQDGTWRVSNAVAVQGPTPRLIRAQQAGVGTPTELRGLMSNSESFRHEP